jgi:putative MFS transporter
MTAKNSTIKLTVLVASLGYFVDIYDLQLFNIVSKKSLAGIGISDPALVSVYDYALFLWQMGGMLLGGILWGVIGDKKGRKNILFGSILLYSLANIANAFVVNIEQYIVIRFIAGLGLAGELGAAITLVSEVMSKEKRGYGTMIIVTMGALGAVAAAFVSWLDITFLGLQNWQVMYIIGGVLGLLLLALRMGTFESEMFDEMKESAVVKGNFLMLFTDPVRFKKYLACILIGLPVWYCVGVLVKFSEQFAITNNVQGVVTTGFAIMFVYVGLSAGDLLSGLLSQMLRSRKKVVLAYLLFTIGISLVFLFAKNISSDMFYLLCFLIGCGAGYWALFVTMASESFGTNIRATATTTVPNFVRGAVIPITLSYKAIEVHAGNVGSAVVMCAICLSFAIAGVLYLPETFGKDLNYVEGN